MTKTTPERAALKVKNLEARARDAAAAWNEYEAKRLGVLARTERLREERLQREAAEVPQTSARDEQRAGKGRRAGGASSR